MLGTKKPFNVFLSAKAGIHQDNGERESQEKTERLHAVILQITAYVKARRGFYCAKSFSALKASLCLNDLLYYKTGTFLLFMQYIVTLRIQH